MHEALLDRTQTWNGQDLQVDLTCDINPRVRGLLQDACEFGLLGSRANQEASSCSSSRKKQDHFKRVAFLEVLDLCASELLEAFGLGSDPSEEMDSEQQTPTCFGPLVAV